MKDLVSMRSEVSGVVEYFQIKTNKIKKVLLPGGMIFVISRKRKGSFFMASLPKPHKYVLKSKLGVVFHAPHGDEIDEGNTLVTIYSEIDGVVSVKKNKITVSKKSIVKEYEIDKNYETIVEEGATVKIGQALARISAPIYGIVKYTFAATENEKDKSRKVEAIEIFQDASAFEIPDDFLIKVSNGAEIEAGTIVAEGVIREDSYGDISIEKESFEEEKDEDEESGAEEEIDEIEEDNKEDFNYDEESIDSEFDDEEEAAGNNGDDEEYQQSSFKKKKKQ